MAKNYGSMRVRESDIIAARKELKEFRHDVAILKKKGLLDKVLYDARSIKPTKYLKSVIKNYRSILTGDATAVKVSKQKLSYYKNKGFKTRQGKVIVPIQKGEKVYATGGDFRVKIKSATGSITKIDLGFPTTSVNQWIDALEKSKIKVKKSEALSFQIYGNNNYKIFTWLGDKSPQQRMAEYMLSYARFYDLKKTANPKEHEELLMGITIFKIERSGEGYELPGKNGLAREKDSEYMQRAKQRRARNYEYNIGRMGDEAYINYRKEKAELEKTRRNKLSGEKKEAYKQAAKSRAQKSREKRKQ